MQTQKTTLLCHYQYDPLNRLTACLQSAQPGVQRFYQKNRLTTEIESTVKRSIMQYEEQLLTQYVRQNGNVAATLLATDRQRSVLNALKSGGQLNPFGYTPYGYRPLEGGLLSLLGFNGERPDPVTGHYLLGNGYRAFNPVLMRFNSPDSWSPFGEGGLNTYGYCEGDTMNREDHSGHVPNFLKPLLRSLHLISKSKPNTSASSIPPVSKVTAQSDSPTTSVSSPVQQQVLTNRAPTEVVSSQANVGVANSPGHGSTSRYDPSLPRVRVTQENRIIKMVPVSEQAMGYIRIVARSNISLPPEKASQMVRGLAGLDELPPGQLYMFPNVPGR